MEDQSLLDEVYVQLHDTGPEFEGWLSNHGPMAADALMHLGRDDAVLSWVHKYASRLEERPGSRFPIAPGEWRESLGDPSRLGDWLKFFERQSREVAWRDLLVEWWPRLLPGAIGSATHGLIRTGHAVRALLTVETEPRVDELGQALAYWAARWEPMPSWHPPSGALSASDALKHSPPTATAGGIRTRIADLSETRTWAKSVAELRSVTSGADVPHALDDITDAAVDHYLRWGHGNPIMMVHMATAPRAASIVLPAIPQHMWVDTYYTAWAVCAALASIYPPTTPQFRAEVDVDVDTVVDQAVAGQDAHAIKFVEVAAEAHRRGMPTALAAAARATSMLKPAVG
jgi:hypothetical protein